MTRNEVCNIFLGQTGLYPWDISLPVVDTGPIKKVLMGPKKGKIFRKVDVLSKSGNAVFSFFVEES